MRSTAPGLGPWLFQLSDGSLEVVTGISSMVILLQRAAPSVPPLSLLSAESHCLRTNGKNGDVGRYLVRLCSRFGANYGHSQALLQQPLLRPARLGSKDDWRLDMRSADRHIPSLLLD